MLFALKVCGSAIRNGSSSAAAGVCQWNGSIASAGTAPHTVHNALYHSLEPQSSPQMQACSPPTLPLKGLNLLPPAVGPKSPRALSSSSGYHAPCSTTSPVNTSQAFSYPQSRLGTQSSSPPPVPPHHPTFPSDSMSNSYHGSTTTTDLFAITNTGSGTLPRSTSNNSRDFMNRNNSTLPRNNSSFGLPYSCNSFASPLQYNSINNSADCDTLPRSNTRADGHNSNVMSSSMSAAGVQVPTFVRCSLDDLRSCDLRKQQVSICPIW